jgi:hypothetical protein
MSEPNHRNGLGVVASGLVDGTVSAATASKVCRLAGDYIGKIEAENKRLRGILSGLERTAEGDIVVAGMELWEADGFVYGPIKVVGMAGDDGDFYAPHQFDWDKCYRTREAAEAAREGGW